MVYTCSCCKYIEYRNLIGGGNYYCILRKDYMYCGSRQCSHFELRDDLKNDTCYNNECNDEDNKVVESRRGKCLDYNFNLCDDCEMWTDSPCYRGE